MPDKKRKPVFIKNRGHQRKRKIDREEDARWAEYEERKAAETAETAERRSEATTAAVVASPSAVASEALGAGALLEHKGVLKGALKRYTSAINILMPRVSESGVVEHIETLMARAEGIKAKHSARKAKRKAEKSKK